MTKKLLALLLSLLWALPAWAIPNVTPPDSDLPNGYVVQNTDWNGMFDTLYNYLNSTVVPAINALQAAGTPTVGTQSLFNGRLTASTGVPFPQNDIASTATFYLTAYGGNLFGIFNPTSGVWAQQKLTSDISLAVPAGTRDLFDVYVSWSGTALVLTTSAYNTVTATNNPAAGTAVVINVPATTAFTVGDCVSITGGGNAEDAIITVVTPGVSITVDWLASSYTAPVVHSQQPTAAIAYQDGVPVNSTSYGQRYVGTILVQNNILADTAGCRGVANYYNRVPRRVAAINTSTTYSQATGNKPCNASKVLGTERILVVAPQGTGLLTPASINRQEYTTGSTAGMAIIEEFDGTASAYSSYFTSSNNFPISLQCFSTFSTPGRHAIDDYFSTSSSSSTITNIATINSVATQLSGTSGWALN